MSGARAVLASFVVAWLSLSALEAAWAAELDLPCGLSPTALCARRGASSLLTQGRASEAVRLLKTARRGAAGRLDLCLLLGQAYSEADNPFWSLRTFSACVRAHPNDCQARAWLVLALLRAGELDSAERWLSEAACPKEPRSTARLELLRGRLARYRKQPEALRRALERTRKLGAVWPEDASIVEAMWHRAAPEALPRWSSRLELALGWTSDALQGSPADPAQVGAPPSSPTARLESWTRLVWPSEGGVRGGLDLELRSQGLSDARVRDLSYLELGLRPALMLGGHLPRLLVGYHAGLVSLAGGDAWGPGPTTLYESHRLELEAEPSSWLLLFAGGGRRIFRQQVRSRWEVDGGLGAHTSIPSHASLVGALQGRIHEAEGAAYTLRGATAALALTWELPAAWRARLGASLGLDDYPNSTGWFVEGAARRDLQWQTSVGFWTPPLAGGRLGLTWELRDRQSTAPAWSSRAHRLALRWRYHGHASLVDASGRVDEGHLALPWGGSGAESADQERVQDLLRQDESVRQGSSCAN